MLIMIIGGISSLFAGIFNDILDFKIFFGVHRNFLTHSPISPLVPVIFFGFLFIGELIQSGNFPWIFASILIGIFEIHIFLDMFNPSGVPIIPGKLIRIKEIPYDDFKLNITFAFIGLVFSAFGLFL